MIRKQLMPLMVVAALAGCATGSGGTAAVSSTVAADTAFAEADAALAAGQGEKAVSLLKAVAVAHPVDKKPWVRMAQIRFDANDYGDAITHAQEALERDPDDTLAYSILAVSGLRVASKALADLTRKNNLQGSVRSEAQDLAKLLRTSLGEDILVNQRPAARKETVRSRSAAPAPAPAVSSAPRSQAKSDKDPFDILK
ncbi:M48 family metallopeptidase [Massilia sp. ZL223]|uniref:tetratricopeptide repeat protein n=1 Tax=Massilia sp. ZL223 TaxID=2824904 RepID=UPI001B82A10E|nr:tetratricopeptide repeat protein [Massilia sp. ZL223]MBQ5965188.1 tetratricopeptide repeat protein [Massilia sp. ZL223]